MLETRIAFYRSLKWRTFSAFGNAIGVSRQIAQKYCLPRQHPSHRRPGPRPSDNLRQLTHGVIDAGNYADELTPAEAAEMMAEIARREEAAKAGEVARG